MIWNAVSRRRRNPRQATEPLCGGVESLSMHVEHSQHREALDEGERSSEVVALAAIASRTTNYVRVVVDLRFPPSGVRVPMSNVP